MFEASQVVFKLVLAIVVMACIVQADEEYTERVVRSVKRFRRESAGDHHEPFNRTLRIVTIDHAPFCIVTKNSNSSEKYDYSGFIPDLIKLLAKRLDFKYEFYNVSAYGRYDSNTKKWSGMIGEVVSNDESNGRDGADIAAGIITITKAREDAVNFLKPFQHSGLSAIVRRPSTPVENPFTFGIFQPMQPTVWCLILLSSSVVALFLWAMNMYNPYEWGNRYSLGLADVQHGEMFNLKGSVWFVFTSLQWQGFERAPNSIASKFLGCVWFAFVTIVVVTYTAGIVNNLYWASMAHRSTQNPVRPRYIDLAHAIQSGDFKFGAISNGQTYRYIMEGTKSTELGIIRRDWSTPEGKEQLVSNFDEGLKKVRAQDSNYVFLMETMSAKFHASRSPCDLVTVGESFGTRSYGFAVPTKIPLSWSDPLHGMIHELMEEGEVEDLERKWFTDAGDCWNMTIIERSVNDDLSTISVSRPQRIDISTFTGPLVMIIIGLLLSVGIAVAEIVYYRRYGRYDSENRPKQPLEMNPEDGNT